MIIMISIKKCPAPANAMLARYSTNGAYADCYRAEVAERVAFSEFIFVFYTTPLFKLERFILKLLVAKPSTDIQARQLAEGSSNKFAAWHVEARSENEILLCDFRGRTRSWLMTAPINAGNGTRTHLYFGSAVVPIRNSKTGEPSLAFAFQALLGFHQIYSVLLLYSAMLRMQHDIRNFYEKRD
jgi:hypothetical protein